MNDIKLSDSQQRNWMLLNVTFWYFLYFMAHSANIINSPVWKGLLNVLLSVHKASIFGNSA